MCWWCCQHFEKARELLAAADAAIKDVSYKLSKLLRMEVLRTDLMQYQDFESLGADQSQADMVKRTKAGLTMDQGWYLWIIVNVIVSLVEIW